MPLRGEGALEWWVCSAVCRRHSREGGWDTGVGRPSSIKPNNGNLIESMGNQSYIGIIDDEKSFIRLTSDHFQQSFFPVLIRVSKQTLGRQYKTFTVQLNTVVL